MLCRRHQGQLAFPLSKSAWLLLPEVEALPRHTAGSTEERELSLLFLFSLRAREPSRLLSVPVVQNNPVRQAPVKQSDYRDVH